MRAFVSVTQDNATGYTALQTAMSDRVLRQQMVERALRELVQGGRKADASGIRLVGRHVGPAPGRGGQG